MHMRLHICEIPPYKQAPADTNERRNQMKRTEALKSAAVNEKTAPIKGKVSLTITYSRKSGRSDAANIIGGIADALNGIAYDDDKQIVEIHYSETVGSSDKYQVSIEEL